MNIALRNLNKKENDILNTLIGGFGCYSNGEPKGNRGDVLFTFLSTAGRPGNQHVAKTLIIDKTNWNKDQRQLMNSLLKDDKNWTKKILGSELYEDYQSDLVI